MNASVATTQQASPVSNPSTSEADSTCTIELTPHIPNPHYLKQCFYALEKRKPLVVPPAVARCILKTTIDIRLDHLDETLQNVLVEMTTYLMLAWPGWAEEGLARFVKYQRFLAFMRTHLRDVVMNEEKYRICRSNVTRRQQDKATDTRDLIKRKDESSFGIEVTGPAHALSGIVFTALGEGDLSLMVVKHEDAEELLLSQLLNWPHVSISVFLLDVAFTRSNVHEFKRYLSSSEEAPSCTAKKGVDVRFVEKSERTVQVFSYEYLCDYMMEVLHCLKEHNLYLVLQAVFTEFLLDVKEANVRGCTIATNTSVCFNIGKSCYIRNKTATYGNTEEELSRKVNFYEEIIPMVEYTLQNFTVEECPVQKFKRLDKNLQSSFLRFSVSCTFCKFTAEGPHAIRDLQYHFQTFHKKQLPLVCSLCRTELDMRYFAENRWKHSCKSKT